MWLVLLIACINLAGLLVARLSARRRELAVRRSLGAGVGRIVRQLLVETTVLTAIGGLLGGVLSVWGLAGFVGWSDVEYDASAFAIALAMGLLCGLLIGLWPAFRFAKPDNAQDLRTRGTTVHVDTARGRRALVVAQVALSIVLLSAASLLGRSFERMYRFTPGSSTNRVLTLRVQGPSQTTIDSDRTNNLVRAIEAVPGVERAGAAIGVPFGHGWSRGDFDIAGRPPFSRDHRPEVRLMSMTSGYFASLGIPILRGRVFSESDRENSPKVAMLNQEAANRYFPGENPIGARVVIDSVSWEIVGVAGNIFTGDFEQIAAPEIYRPMSQWSRKLFWITVLTRSDPDRLRVAVAAAV